MRRWCAFSHGSTGRRQGGVDEIGAVRALACFGRDPALKDISFPDDLRRRAARRPAPLPRRRGVGHRHCAGPVPHRQRRPVRRGHHRHHPHPRRRARPRVRCATATPASSRAISPSRPQFSPRERRARRSTPSRVARYGRPASISTTARATASACSFPCTRDRNASPRPGRRRCCPA